MENSEDKKQRLHSQNYTESRNTSYSIVRRYGSITFDEALTQLRDVLKDKGFDIIGEMDVKDYLKDYNIDMSHLIIMMVCHKETAANLLSNDIQMTSLVPCKISIKAIKDASLIEVSIDDVETTWGISDKSEIEEIAKSVGQDLKEILDHLGPKHFKL